MRAGPYISANGDCLFSVWAPEKGKMLLHIIDPADRILEMVRDMEGYFTLRVENVNSGCKYYYQPDGKNDYPDPGSHYQPEGVHGPSEVCDHSGFKWSDQSWKGRPLSETVFYELHVG